MARYDWTLLRAGQFRLDGGGMFGVIPRVVWERTTPCDEKHRIQLQHNCLLLRSTSHTVLIEAGTGDKLAPKMRTIFDLEDRTVEDAVIEADTRPEHIDLAVVSHLHFDHAGGLTRRTRDGETPDWIAEHERDQSGDAAEISLTFPNATIVAQATEWADAIANDAVMTRTYYRDHLLPIEPRLRLVSSPPPFAPGHHPHRAESPPAPLEDRMTEVAPGLWVFLVPGHTRGQQAVLFNDKAGQPVCFVPDVMPTRAHAGAAYSLSYDIDPYLSMVTRRWLLREAAERNWLLVLDHEPDDPLVRVVPDDRGWYALVDACPPV